MILSANIFGFFIPIFIIIVCYISIFVYFKELTKPVDENNNIKRGKNSSSVNQESKIDTASSERESNSEPFLLKIIYDSIESIHVIRLLVSSNDERKISISEYSSLNQESAIDSCQVNIPLKLRLGSTVSEKRRRRRKLKKELKIAKNIILIIFAFCLAWLLFFIFFDIILKRNFIFWFKVSLWII